MSTDTSTPLASIPARAAALRKLAEHCAPWPKAAALLLEVAALLPRTTQHEAAVMRERADALRARLLEAGAPALVAEGARRVMMGSARPGEDGAARGPVQESALEGEG